MEYRPLARRRGAGPVDETEDHVRTERTATAEGQTEETSSVSRAAKSKSKS
ncbi:hypothetical protein T261_0097 [Streptomyces lydicus]|nr:hypothetical protein T261_0097 [Streptomyces lydicus]